MAAANAKQCIESWPEESREAAQLVIEQYGEPNEVTETMLTWHNPGPWKRIHASKAFFRHNFPAPHIDSVESVIDYRVPVDKFTPLASFDGSVVAERTAGEVSARCHDEQANFLALKPGKAVPPIPIQGSYPTPSSQPLLAKASRGPVELAPVARRRHVPKARSLRGRPAPDRAARRNRRSGMR